MILAPNGEPLLEREVSAAQYKALAKEGVKRGIPIAEVILEALDKAAAPPKETLRVMMERRTVEAMRLFCEAANVIPDEWAGGWIEALVGDSLDPGYDVRRIGITEDLLNNYSPDGNPDYERPKAEAKAMAARFNRIKRKLNEEEGGLAK